jgi:macrolide transport system ATP-binding/permease protein
MRELLQDLKYEMRVLVKSPVVLVVVVATFALGIGANAAMFGVIKSVLLRPLPGTRAPDQLVVVGSRTKSGAIIPLSYPLYREYRDHNEVFTALAASAMTPMSLSTGGPAARIWGELVSGEYFDALGAAVALGRPILPSDNRAPGASPVAVISDAVWHARFGADPSVLGRAIRLNDHPFTIVGVTAPGFRGSMVGLALDVFVPLMMHAQVFSYDVRGDLLTQPNTFWLIAQGRLKSGLTIASAQPAMDVLGAQTLQLYPADDMAQRAILIPLWRSPFGAQTFVLPVAAMLLGACLLVLLVACGNVANVLLSRVTRRSTEMAVRLAIGAGRIRLVRQLLTGSLVVTLLGAAAGLAVAAWTSRLFTGLPGPNGVPVSLNAGVDMPVLAFSLALAVMSGVLVGLLPALRISRVSLVSTLKEDTGISPAGRSWLRKALVVAQIAVSLVLLVSATLLIRSLQRTRAIDPGFDADRGVLVSIDLKGGGYDQPTAWAFCRRLLQEVGMVPGVGDASVTWQVPLSGFGSAAPSAGVGVEGYVPQKNEDEMIFHYNAIGPGYLHTMRIPLVDGREFTERDDASAAPVVIVNDTMARRFWPGGHPIGKRLISAGVWRTVVGVARDAKYLSLSEQPQPYFYLPYFQSYQPQVTVVVRTAGAPASFQLALQNAVQALNPALPVVSTRTLDRQVASSLARVQVIALILTSAGIVGLLLAVIGVYGVMAQNVAQDLPAFGVRMVMGARPADIFRLVLSGGFRLLGAGVVAGLLLSLAATAALRRLLFGVSPTDPLTFAGVALLLGFAVLLACWVPAWRAARLQPIQLLRHQ